MQHNLGSSKWDRIIDTCENYLLRNEWNGKNIRFTLKMHITKHREAHNELVRAAQFVQYELPNGHTRVSRLLKSITSKDGSILAAVTHIQGTSEMREDFESAADFLLLTAPTPREIERSYRISAVNLGSSGGSNHNSKKNKGIGKSGVEFRYHSKDEYARLNKDQKKELHEWRHSNKKESKSNASMDESRISSLEMQVEELLKTNDAMKAKISSITISENKGEPKPNPLTNMLNQRS